MSQPPLGLTARAIVSRVIDGDTIDVMLQLPVRVRLLDCWTPEIHGAEKIKGIESKRQMESLVSYGSHVVVHIPTGAAGGLADILTFGRVLGKVWRSRESESLSELMISSGLATAKRANT